MTNFFATACSFLPCTSACSLMETDTSDHFCPLCKKLSSAAPGEWRLENRTNNDLERPGTCRKLGIKRVGKLTGCTIAEINRAEAFPSSLSSHINIRLPPPCEERQRLMKRRCLWLNTTTSPLLDRNGYPVNIFPAGVPVVTDQLAYLPADIRTSYRKAIITSKGNAVPGAA